MARERLRAEPWKSRARGQACGQGDGHCGQDHEDSGRVRHNQGVGKLARIFKTRCVSTITAYSQLIRLQQWARAQNVIVMTLWVRRGRTIYTIIHWFHLCSNTAGTMKENAKQNKNRNIEKLDQNQSGSKFVERI